MRDAIPHPVLIHRGETKGHVGWRHSGCFPLDPEAVIYDYRPFWIIYGMIDDRVSRLNKSLR